MDINLRDSAISVVQTINASGAVTRVVYTLPDLSTLEDVFTYGPNSNVEPTSVTFGQISLRAATLLGGLILTGFTVGANGTTLTFLGGVAATSLNGYVTASGVNIPFTYVSGGVATLTAPVSINDTSVTATITSSTPELGVVVTGVPTVNNATGLAKKTLTWTGSNVTSSGDIVTTTAASATGLSSYAINTSKPFTVEGEVPASADYLGVVLDTNTNNLSPWGVAGSLFPTAILASGTVTYTATGSALIVGVGAAPETNPLKFRFTSTGNGTILVQTTADNITYTTRRTVTGITGVLYLKVLSRSAVITNGVVKVYA